MRTYRWRGVEYPSVTSILALAVAKPALVGWAARVAAETGLADEHRRVSRAAAGRGTRTHNHLEALALGAPTPILAAADEAAPYIATLDAWWAEHGAGIEVLASEATVVSTTWGYAGTLDGIWRRAGRTIIVDAKTSAAVYPETSLQLVAYARADVVALPDGSECALPAVDDAAVLHVTPERTELVPVPIGDAEWRAWRSAVVLARWLDQAQSARVPA